MNINELARADALTCKTYINCCYSNIPYDNKHREKIESIDAYINRPIISNALAFYELLHKCKYHYDKVNDRWHYEMLFINNSIKAIATSNKLIIQQDIK